MERHATKSTPLTKMQRLVLALFGVMMLVYSMGSLWSGRLDYVNHLNALVFAPFGALAGTLVILLAIRQKK